MADISEFIPVKLPDELIQANEWEFEIGGGGSITYDQIDFAAMRKHCFSWIDDEAQCDVEWKKYLHGRFLECRTHAFEDWHISECSYPEPTKEDVFDYMIDHLAETVNDRIMYYAEKEFEAKSDGSWWDD